MPAQCGLGKACILSSGWHLKTFRLYCSLFQRTRISWVRVVVKSRLCILFLFMYFILFGVLWRVVGHFGDKEKSSDIQSAQSRSTVTSHCMGPAGPLIRMPPVHPPLELFLGTSTLTQKPLVGYISWKCHHKASEELWNSAKKWVSEIFC